MDEDDVWEFEVDYWDDHDYLEIPPLTPPAGGLSEIEGDEVDPWLY